MTRWIWISLAALAIAASVALGWQQIALSPRGKWIETNDAAVLGQGRTLYDRYCASCHGANLEGQPDWMKRLPSGRMPAPPHDATGHTLHHPSDVLFGIVKGGVEKYAPAGLRERYAGVRWHAFRPRDPCRARVHSFDVARGRAAAPRRARAGSARTLKLSTRP